MKNTKFFNVNKEYVETSEGKVQLPILYYDSSTWLSLFRIDENQANEILKPMGLKALSFLGDTAVAVLVVFEYRDTTVGVYNEVGLGLLSLPEDEIAVVSTLSNFFLSRNKRSLGITIIDLPVTTKEANAAGREIWGYPKFVSEIPVEFTKTSLKSSVLDPDNKKPIFNFEGPIASNISLPSLDFITYSTFNNETVKTYIDSQGDFAWHVSPDLTLKVGTSNHRMAKHLNLLDLDNKKPFLMATTHNTQTILNRGTNLKGESVGPKSI